MSRLADRIKRAARPGAAPIGFGLIAERRASPTLLCLLRLDNEQVSKVGDAAAGGADAVIISGLDSDKLGQAIKKVKDLPVGLRLENAERATVAGWETATASFLNSPEGQNWPGGAALSRIQQILTANHLEDAEDKLEALKSAWLFMQQQDYETQINEKLRTATPDELREAIGYGRSSGMFGQR